MGVRKYLPLILIATSPKVARALERATTLATITATPGSIDAKVALARALYGRARIVVCDERSDAPSFDTSAPVCAFLSSLLATEIGGISFVAATTQDLYELYVYWCSRSEERPQNLATMASMWGLDGRVVIRRKRYIVESQLKGPHSVAIRREWRPTQQAAEIGELSELVVAFRDHLRRTSDLVEGSR